MSNIKHGKSAQELETQLEQTLIAMAQNQKSGSYIQAQNNRVRSQQLKKDLQLRRIYQMQMRHKNQTQQINKAHNQEMHNFNSFWENKLSDFQAQSCKLQQQMGSKHGSDLQKQGQQLQKVHALKVKESSECLNLRKMEQHMVKQKNYVEAHKVQQRILQLEKQQKEMWLNNRQIKIQTALNTLRAKQAAELGYLQKRIKTGRDEQLKDRLNEQVRLRKKFQNIVKQLKMQQDKQVLAFKGQFKSKGGLNSPLNKSKLLQTGMSK